MRYFPILLLINLIITGCSGKPEPKENNEFESDTIPIGHLEDNFIEVVDMDEPLPDWANKQFDRYRNNYHRLLQVKPTFLEADFNGDGENDVAVFVNNSANDKRGIIFLFRNGQSRIAGGGSNLGNAGDDFNWSDEWKLIEDKIVYESTFTEDGDALGEKEVELNYPAISLRQDEGSGGLIYFKDSSFVWIHQGD